MVKRIAWFVLTLLMLGSCGEEAIIEVSSEGDDPVVEEPTYFSSGEILIVSGGTVDSTATPYPLHNITHWSPTGEYIATVATTVSAGSRFYAAAIDIPSSSLYYTIDNVDRLERIDMDTGITTTHIIDASLTGNTLRAVAALSDGAVVVAESTTSIEKYDVDKVRVTTNYPITVSATINSIQAISGDRFVVLFTGGTDTPRVYNNDGTLVTTIGGLACGNNCDPNSIVELPDGRFAISYNIASLDSIEIFDANFAHLGQLYKNSTLMPRPGSMAVFPNGDILVCSTSINVCERLTINGIVATRVGDRAFIGDGSLMRQPTSVLIVP